MFILRKLFVMRYCQLLDFIYILLVLSVFGCSENDSNSKIDPTNPEQPIAAFELDHDGEFEISKITHGDMPSWLALVKREGDSLDMAKFIELIDDKDTLAFADLTYSGEFIWNKDLQFFITDFELNKQVQEREISVYEGRGLRLSYVGDTLNSITISSLDKLKLKGKDITSYSIEDFKKMFPKSYSLRNYYGDGYQINFIEEAPESYDHLIVKTDSVGLFFHFRFVNGEIVDVEYDRDRGY